MTPATLDRPPATRSPVSRTEGPGFLLPHDRGPRWTLPVALLGAIVLHVIAILVLGIQVEYRHEVPQGLRETLTPLVLVPDITPISEPDAVPVGFETEPPAEAAPAEPPAVQPSRPLAARPETRPLVPPASPVRAGAETGVTDSTAGRGLAGGGDPGRLSDRLRPRGADTRLWAPIPVEPPPSKEVDAFLEAIAPLYASMGAWNDSTIAAALAAAEAMDWTTVDENGGRWGISPGKIHLGKITLPLPFGFAPPPGRREELSGRMSGWAAIQRQRTQTEALESFEERVKAIRERKAAERRDTTRDRYN